MSSFSIANRLLPSRMRGVLFRHRPEDIWVSSKIPVPKLNEFIPPGTEASASASDRAIIWVKYAGVNRADIMQRDMKYPPPAHACDRLGLEVSGELVALGNETPDALVPPVGSDVMALVDGGAYAEFVSVCANHVLPIPRFRDLENDDQKFQLAAAIPEAYTTAYQLVRKLANVQPDDRVLVLAASSSVGLAAIELCRKLCKCETVVGVCSNSKVAYPAAAGATTVVGYLPEEAYRKYMETQYNSFFSVILDCVGGSSFNLLQKVASVDARWVMYGSLGTVRLASRVSIAPMLEKRITIMWTTLRSRSDAYKTELVRDMYAEVAPLFSLGVLSHPRIDSSYNLEDVALAHDKMRANQNAGKMVLKVRDYLVF
ncbi:Quinone oxidoreductase PIG3 [Porphyridium purpureum]|uniref:Quinone oxidoreductase PIG3 n=1 Tax=Porphyridium purpureum TaxID=35688 RepID=A0A5J4YXN1_PORPP|nr:Quinone oxidoreductase PIG3 [Porphyridium purpureum]|eukprot:POR1911..scf209_3